MTVLVDEPTSALDLTGGRRETVVESWAEDMDAKAVENIARIRRSYDLIQEAHTLLEKAGHPDICAALYLPLGLMEERFDLASLTEVGAAIARKNASSDEN